MATLSDSVVDVESLEYVIDPSAGVDEIAEVETVVTRPLESIVNVTADVFVPYVPAVTPVVPSVAVPWLIVRSPASVVERLVIVPVVEFSVPIVPAVALMDPLKVPPVIVAVEDVNV